jgi:signal transduction histidine kinase/GAF domain-containing protein
VLVIYASFRGFAPFEGFHKSFVTAVRSKTSDSVDIEAEFLDVMVSRGEAYDRSVTEYLREKYAGSRVVAIVGASARAALAASRIRAEVFPSASLVYTYADQKMLATVTAEANVTGVTGVNDLKGTSELAMRLVPDTKYVAIVFGASDMERAWYERAPNEVKSGAPTTAVIQLFGLSKDELLERLRTLPEHTVVVWVVYFRDPQGITYAPREVLTEAQKVSTAPIFGMFDYDIGSGAVGGRVADVSRFADETGTIVARIVDGEPASRIPPVHVGENLVQADWRELQRWDIDPSRLPTDTVVLFREPTVWDEYRWYIIGGIVVVLLEALLILGLLAQRTRRMRTQATLAERLRSERLISDLSARFVDLPVDQIDSALARGLEEIRVVYDADRVILLQVGESSCQSTVRYSALADGIESLPDRGDEDEFADFLEVVQRGEPFQFSTLGEIPRKLDRETADRRGVRSAIVVPIHAAGARTGALGIGAMKETRIWPSDAATRLTMLADIFANALVRKRAVTELQRSEAMSTAVLSSIAAQVCVVGRDGRILVMNDAWRLASGNRDGPLSCLLVDEQCPAESGAPAPCATMNHPNIRDGLRAVLAGSQSVFTTEYRVTTPGADGWYLLTVEQLKTPEGGAVLSHQNITSRKRAELEAEQRRLELAHFARVSTMGELAASIAHELNQPLSGVLSNAQAAVRLLNLDPPNLAEVRESLGDIIDDDRRASEVIRRLRSMLQKGVIEYTDVDVNDVVAEVLKLLASDATLRNVTLDHNLADNVPLIHGDHVQLKQVILNLVVNAMDAMKEIDVKERRVTVRTIKANPSTVLIAVVDRGNGIEEDKLGRIFQAFFTTKREGMGMGLSIARTIVEAHGGVLWAVNNPDCGASFLCRLPIASAT